MPGTSRTLWVTSLLLTVAVGCGGPNSDGARGLPSADSEPSDTAKPVVVATIPMIADLASEIAGSHISVETLLTEGVDPHTYQPNAADIRRLTEADAVLYNGLLLEGAIEADLNKLGDRVGTVRAVGDSVSKDRLRTPEEFEGHPDPHIWMDVSLWSEIVPEIRDVMISLSPDAEADFNSNANALLTKLGILHEYVSDAVSSIPEGQRHLITAHDAFGYFAVAYGINVSSVQGVSTESEAGLEDVKNLVDLIVAEKIPAIFFESSVTNRNIKAVIEGVQAQGQSVSEGGELFSDSAGPAGTWEGTYFGMMEHNANTIATSLGGAVPEGGFRGALDAGAQPETAKTERDTEQ